MASGEFAGDHSSVRTGCQRITRTSIVLGKRKLGAGFNIKVQNSDIAIGSQVAGLDIELTSFGRRTDRANLSTFAGGDECAAIRRIKRNSAKLCDIRIGTRVSVVNEVARTGQRETDAVDRERLRCLAFTLIDSTVDSILRFSLSEIRNGNGLDGVVGHAGNKIFGGNLAVFNGFFNILDLGSADVDETL